MFSDIKRLSFRHKNNKFGYYFLNYIRRIIPSLLFQNRLKSKLSHVDDFSKEYIQKRVNYYNKLNYCKSIYSDLELLSEFKLGKKNKTYFFDCYEYTRFFNSKNRINFSLGDVIHIPELPTIVKSRPIEGNNANSIILNLDKIRHFLFVNDKNKFIDKKDMLVGRSKAPQPHRIRFLQMYFDHPMCNIGQINQGEYPQFVVNRMTISEHLKYKYILCLEGWDVASNLKWVMSSNSLAIMPKPKYETWFMEGTLIPNYHYVLIKDDYSDLEERLAYYNTHTEEALKIIENAHVYVNQFKNKKQEDLISLLVLKKYFEKIGQETNA